MVPDRIVARILSRITVTPDGCWLWTGALAAGYGQIGWHEGGVPCHGLTHRIVYTALVGEIPEGLTLDHLCHKPAVCAPVISTDCPHRRCCNPADMEPVTRAVNTMRGGGFAPRNLTKAHCPQGHEYTPANTYVAPSGWRQCHICRRSHIDALRVRRGLKAVVRTST